LLACVALFWTGCGKKGPLTVVVYTSQDEVFAEPIFREFETQTGIQVRPVFDSEAVKTVGLVNRLLTERNNPQCDVFWNNEEFRTRQLAARDIFRPTNGWTHLGYRTRRIVINTNLLSAASAPRTFSDATNTLWRGKAALAYPLFGTTARWRPTSPFWWTAIRSLSNKWRAAKPGLASPIRTTLPARNGRVPQSRRCP
jgi:predicted small lipoprotein YifL